MKKLIILSVAAVATIFASCSVNGKSLKSSEDSVAYAVGVSLGKMAFDFDSTLNLDVVIAGLKNSFKKDTSMKPEAAQAIIQEYMTVTVPKKNKAEGDKMVQEKVEKEGYTKTESGLAYKVITPGTGAKVELNDSLEIHYILKDKTGKTIQSSYDSGRPMVFVNSQGAMIPGFTEGLLLLNEGAKADLFIKSDLGYGDQGGPVKGGDPLMFEVEVVKVTKPIAKPEQPTATTKK